MLKVLPSSPPQPLKFPMRLAVIDLGANSAHLLIVQIWEDCTYTQVYWDRAMIRLGMPVFEDGPIDSQTRSNALSVLWKFQQSCRHHEVDVIRTVATSAVREASNRAEFLRAIRENVGVAVDVISGSEEARLTALAATETLGMKKGKVFVVDVGGGSTEGAWLEDNVCKKLWSFQLGPVRALKQVPLGDPPGKEGLENLREYASKTLAPMFGQIQERPDRALATSGTALCLGQLCGTKRRAVTSLETHIIVMPALKNLLERLAEMTLEKRRTWLGEFSDRADTLLSGGMILLSAMEALGLDTFVTGGKGLREGIILDFLQKEILTEYSRKAEGGDRDSNGGTLPTSSRAVRKQNVLKLARTFHYNAEHCQKTLDLASWLFDGLRPLTWLGDEDRFYLQSAALLHDIGYSISATNHHLHSQYLVMNSDLEGFHEMEKRLVANLVRYQRNEVPSPDHPDYASLPDPLRKKVDILSGILKVADSLDFTHRGLVEDIKVEPSDDQVSLIVSSSAPVDLELNELNTIVDFLERTLDRKVVVTAQASGEVKHLDAV